MYIYELIDLSHTITPEIPSWSGTGPCILTTTTHYSDCTTTTKFRIQHLSLENGTGTHMDAPAHCIPGRKTITDYTPKDLYLPCFTIDFSEDNFEPDHQITIEDLMKHESIISSNLKRSFVLLHTGWSKHWNNKKAYRNNLVFPTLSVEAAQFLASKSIAGIGIDTLSVDLPEAFNKAESAHMVLLSKNIFIIENVANGHNMPPFDGYVMIAPLKIEGATESPVRLTGIVYE